METTTIHLIFGVIQILGFSLLIYGGYKYAKAKQKLDKKLILTNAYDACTRARETRQLNFETYVLDYTVTPDQFNELTPEQVELALKHQGAQEIAAIIQDHLAISQDRKAYAKLATLSLRARVMFKVVNELTQE